MEHNLKLFMNNFANHGLENVFNLLDSKNENLIQATSFLFFSSSHFLTLFNSGDSFLYSELKCIEVYIQIYVFTEFSIFIIALIYSA